MAIQLNRGPGVGAMLGSALGGGIGDVLKGLGKRGEMNIMSQHLQQQGLPGILAQLDPQVQAAYLKQFGAAQQMAQGQQRQQAFNQALEEALGGGQQPSGLAERVQSQLGAPQEDQQPGSEQRMVGDQQMMGQDQKIPQPQIEPERPMTQEMRFKSDIDKLDKKINDPSLSPDIKERLRERRDKIEEKLEKRQETLHKETNDFYKQVHKESRGAQTNNKRLGRMEELVWRGNLSHPMFASVLDSVSKGVFGFGIDLSWLTSPDSQEFKKLSTDFLKEAKDIFGSRLTDADVKYFLQTVPTLSQTDHGKLRVISNLKNFNDAALKKKDIMDQIIEENGGIRPRNLESLTEERMQPILDKMADEFKGAY